MISKDQLVQKLMASFPTAVITASDMTGTSDHWQVKIRAEEFRGKSLIEQHQMVYKTLGTWMEREIHALSLDTSAPKE